MRSIWTGSIAFGLVNVPVKAYGATQDHDVDLHQVHDADGGRIRYQRRCEVCRKKIDYGHIEKAFDDGDRTVVLSEEDIESLPAEKSREIDVVQFVPNNQIDPIMLERSYYLEPDSKSPKAYRLLVKTLENTELTAVVKFALRQKTRLGALRVSGKFLVLQGILWADEVRDTSFLDSSGTAKISAQELKMSSALVDQFRGDFNPSDFADDYQLELRSLIDEKIKHGDSLDTAATFGDEVEAEKEGNSGGNVIDLMEALKRSVDQKRVRAATRGDSTKKGASGTSTAKKPGTKAKPTGAEKKTAKTSASKKTIAKGKSTPKKPAAKKTAATTATRKGA